MKKINEKPFGTKILVEKIYEKSNPLEPAGKFNNKVRIISLGCDVKRDQLKEGVEVRIIEGSGMEIERDFLLIVDHNILTIYEN